MTTTATGRPLAGHLPPAGDVDRAEAHLRLFRDGNPTRDQAEDMLRGYVSRWLLTDDEVAELLNRFGRHPFETAAAAGPRWRCRP